MGGKQQALAEAIEAAKAHGWRLHHYTASGYAVMRCGCPGKHQMSLPKTPSGPNTYKNKVNRMHVLCTQALA